jgi:outer membrane protein assembly factor BamB
MYSLNAWQHTKQVSVLEQESPNTYDITTQQNHSFQISSFATSPFIANGILFIQGASQLQALDPTSGQVLWSTPSNGAHWQSPLVVNGNVYVLDNNAHLTDYALQ